MMSKPSVFQRFFLPGLAFKGVVIGGGYATGRELAEYFVPSGPVGGLMGMTLAMFIWSLMCVLTFLFARLTQSEDYRTFFRNLLGPFWVAFEVAYIPLIILTISVFGAAAGAIGEAMFGLPPLVGTSALMAAVVLVVMFGNTGVERLFKYASFFLYAVYAIFLVLALTSFGDRIAEAFAAPVPAEGWVWGGSTYATYNLLAATIILPMLRHLTSNRDAVVAGLLCGPLAMIPAILFFLAMLAFYPAIGGEAVPSNFLLERMGVPAFHFFFQGMIFVALLESTVGSIHAINERVAASREAKGKGELGTSARLGISL
ncbi:MAG TPA: hypothetical protein VNT25_07005, partial [Allosphingosinicella sp.]|nr:hypothetical protein [Allosphingosinicella sp.]